MYTEQIHRLVLPLKKTYTLTVSVLVKLRPVFLYQEVEGGKSHVVGTESEFSANELNILTEEGRLYFVNQYIKMGAFVGGANLELVDEEKGKSEVIKTNMAIKGTCTSM